MTGSCQADMHKDFFLKAGPSLIEAQKLSSCNASLCACVMRCMQCMKHVCMAQSLTASVAVVRRTEDGDNILVVAPVVAFHDQLMRPGHKCQTVCVVELL